MYWSQYPTIRYKPNPQLTKDKNHVSFFFIIRDSMLLCLFLNPSMHNFPKWSDTF